MMSFAKACSYSYFGKAIILVSEYLLMCIKRKKHWSFPMLLHFGKMLLFVGILLYHTHYLLHRFFHPQWAAIEEKHVSFSVFCKIFHRFRPHAEQNNVGIKVGLFHLFGCVAHALG